MSKEPLKLVIVGHVDHGKSTLIGRLFYDTGSLPADRIEEMKRVSRELGRKTEFAYLLDHLEEERQQNITIDTTQVFFKSKTREYVIIDAPGHVEFVKNMVTGASQADVGVLIIDATCGIQEQTRRHAYLLSLLGIPQIIVIFNKMDLVDFSKQRYRELKRQVDALTRQLKAIDIKDHIPISAINGDNIVKRNKKAVWYKGPTLLESFDSLQKESTAKKQAFIMPIQDVYLVNEKRMLVGTVACGTVRENDRVKVLPQGLLSVVNSVERFQESIKQASAQESIGMTLKDQLFVERGSIICTPGREPKLSNEFKAVVFWMSKFPLNTSDRIVLRCATQESICSVDKISKRINSSSFEILEEDAEQLLHLEVGEVEIKTKKPLVLGTFNKIRELGRFVLVRQDDICAGGTVMGIHHKARIGKRDT